MPLGFESWVGLRYVRSRSGNRFVSMISAISIAGIAIAVAVLIIVMSVVNGFERELTQRLLAMTAHASIIDSQSVYKDWPDIVQKVESDDRVLAAAPYIDGQALLTSAGHLTGASLRGIAPQIEQNVSGVAKLLTTGSLDSLVSGEYNMVLGVELADHLAVSVGDKVTATLAEGVVTPAGILPRARRFTVSGMYRVGMYEFDRRLAFINLEDAQRLFRKRGRVSGINLAVNDIYRAAEIVRDVAIEIGEPVAISDWTRRHVNFFRSIQITKSILFVILLMVVAVAAFNIVSTLVMVVKDKQSDIAILRTSGATPATIMRIFITQGSVIGLSGTLIGVIAGIVLALNLETLVGFFEGLFNMKFLAAEVYFISDLPSELRIADVLSISVTALSLALASTFYPAWRAAKTMPAEALRYE